MIYYRVQLKNPATNEVIYEHIGKKVKLPTIEICSEYPGTVLFVDTLDSQVLIKNDDENKHEEFRISKVA